MDQRGQEQFVMQLTACQNRIYGYILSLVADRDHADDLLQQTNLVLWRKAEDFQPGTNFVSWAFRIAFFEVLAHRERVGRDRHVFTDELLELVSIEAETADHQAEQRLKALAGCIRKLSPWHGELVRRRYADGHSISDIAELTGRRINAVKSAIHRVRKALLQCVERTLAVGGAG